MDTVIWKLKLLVSGAAYANSRLHAVRAEVLILASGNENLLPSEEADRLLKMLKNCTVRYFRNRGHCLLMEYDFNLLTVMKGVNIYRRERKRDAVMDFIPPTINEFKKSFGEDFIKLSQLLSPVMYSTLGTGKIVRGLAGVPDKGPLLFVGYHQLLAMEIPSMIEGFLSEKKEVIRVLSNPVFFVKDYWSLRQELPLFDALSMYGGIPVSAINMYKLFERNEFVLLYPGGVREALHRKGEEYQCLWPDKQEFVRMAARFGVTIIPFGCVGEDDCLEIVLDYNDQKNIPYLRDWIKTFNEDLSSVRSDFYGPHKFFSRRERNNQALSVKFCFLNSAMVSVLISIISYFLYRDTIIGEDGNQDVHMPVVLPKVPGRLYFLFGKPIETKRMDNVLRDKGRANDFFLHTKSEVENLMSYLKRKRDEDPSRSIMMRTLYQANWGSSTEVPSFKP